MFWIFLIVNTSHEKTKTNDVLVLVPSEDFKKSQMFHLKKKKKG